MTDFFTLQLKYVNEVEKTYRRWLRSDSISHGFDEKTCAKVKKQIEEEIKNKFILAKQQTWIVDLVQNGETLRERWYSIDISPDTNKMTQYELYRDMAMWKCKGFIYWECAIEQHGSCSETIGQGYHCHFNVISKYGYKQTLSLALDFWVKRKVAHNCIQVNPIKTLTHLDIRKKYIRGIKKDDKMDKVEYDKIWRKNNQWEDILSST